MVSICMIISLYFQTFPVWMPCTASHSTSHNPSHGRFYLIVLSRRCGSEQTSSDTLLATPVASPVDRQRPEGHRSSPRNVLQNLRMSCFFLLAPGLDCLFKAVLLKFRCAEDHLRVLVYRPVSPAPATEAESGGLAFKQAHPSHSHARDLDPRLGKTH